MQKLIVPFTALCRSCQKSSSAMIGKSLSLIAKIFWIGGLCGLAACTSTKKMSMGASDVQTGKLDIQRLAPVTVATAEQTYFGKFLYADTQYLTIRTKKRPWVSIERRLILWIEHKHVKISLAKNAMLAVVGYFALMIWALSHLDTGP